MASIFELTQGTWQERLEYVVAMMREMSGARGSAKKWSRPYAARCGSCCPAIAGWALSRRGLEAPKFRITRSSIWTRHINPWKESELLPVYDRGLLQELLYAGEPRIINHPVVDPDDPAPRTPGRFEIAARDPAFRGGDAF